MQVGQIARSLYILRVTSDGFEHSEDWFGRVLEAFRLVQHVMGDGSDVPTRQEDELYEALKMHLRDLLQRCMLCLHLFPVEQFDESLHRALELFVEVFGATGSEELRRIPQY